MGWYNCHVTISCDVNLTSQPISERLRKVVFRDFRIENKVFAFVKIRNEWSINALRVSIDQLNTKKR